MIVTARGSGQTSCPRALQRLLIADDGGQQRYRSASTGAHARGRDRGRAVHTQLVRREAQIRRRAPAQGQLVQRLLVPVKVNSRPTLHLIEDDIVAGTTSSSTGARTSSHPTRSRCRPAQPAVPAGDEPCRRGRHRVRAPQFQSLAVSFRVGRSRRSSSTRRLPTSNGRSRTAPGTGRAVRSTRTTPNRTASSPRIIEAIGWHTVYPFGPRAYHAGFVGYHHKGATLVGTVEQRAATLLRMTDELNAASYLLPEPCGRRPRRPRAG